MGAKKNFRLGLKNAKLDNPQKNLDFNKLGAETVWAEKWDCL